MVQRIYSGSSSQLLPIKYIKDRPGCANLVLSSNTKNGLDVSSCTDGAPVQLSGTLGTDYGRWTFTAVGPLAAAAADTTSTTTTTGGTNPCASFCSNPTVFTSTNYQAGALGTAAACRETTAAIAGVNISNAAGRIINERPRWRAVTAG